jgi:hypothetical protein
VKPMRELEDMTVTLHGRAVKSSSRRALSITVLRIYEVNETHLLTRFCRLPTIDTGLASECMRRAAAIALLQSDSTRYDPS